MKLTESKLRQIIRSVIREEMINEAPQSNDVNESLGYGMSNRKSFGYWMSNSKGFGLHASESGNKSDAVILNVLSGNQVGTGRASEFLSKHKVDLGKLKKAKMQGVINSYDIRDIVNGKAHSLITKNFFKNYVKESVNETVKRGKRYGDWTVAYYEPVQYDDYGAPNGGQIKITNQKNLDTITIQNDLALRGNKWFVSVNRRTIKDSNPEKVIMMAIKNWSNESVNEFDVKKGI